MKESTKKAKVFLLIIAIEVLLNSLRLTQQTVWADECFTIELVKKSIGEIISGTINDFHPPLYYLVCKFFCSIFGYSVPVFRFVSLLPIIILSISGFLWLRKRSNNFTVFIFATLVLLMPTSYYSIEIRMYSLSMLFISLFVFSIVDYVDFRDKKNIYAASVFAILGAYTHYFVLLCVATIYLYHLIKLIICKRNLKNYILSILACIIIYFPWLIIMFKQMTSKNAYSMGVNSLFYYLKPLAGYVCLLFGTMRSVSDITYYEAILTVILCAITIALLFAYFIKCKKSNNLDSSQKLFIDVLAFFIFTFIFIYIIGCVMDMHSHKFVARYLYPLSGIIFILISLCLSDLTNNAGMLLKIVLPFICTTIILFDFGKTIYNEYITDKRQFDTLKFINENITQNDLIVTDSRLYEWIVLDYYLKGRKHILCLDSTKIKNPPYDTSYDTIYFIHNKFDGSIPDPGKQWNIILTSELGENAMTIYSLSDGN